jgi:hypothetical protein
VPLTQGKVAVIDAADWDLVSKHRWHAVRNRRTFYAYTKLSLGGSRQKSVSMHRMILGVPDGTLVDHEDGDGLNNRRNNIRPATSAQNNQNARHRVGISGYRGVVRHARTQKWQARIKATGRWYHLGYHIDPAEAARAYDKAAKALHGPFAVCNFPLEASA